MNIFSISISHVIFEMGYTCTKQLFDIIWNWDITRGPVFLFAKSANPSQGKQDAFLKELTAVNQCMCY